MSGSKYEKIIFTWHNFTGNYYGLRNTMEVLGKIKIYVPNEIAEPIIYTGAIWL